LATSVEIQRHSGQFAT